MRAHRTHTAGSAHSPTAHSASKSVRASRLNTRYEWLSTRPLHILAFILPFIVFYWLGAALFLGGEGAVEQIKAERILGGFFDAFGVVSPYLTGLALISVLLIWHMLVKDRWNAHPRVMALMTLESAVWMLPLLLLLALLPGGGGMVSPIPQSSAWTEKLTISIGAGIYEEFLFRMIVIAAVNLLLVDLARLSNFKANAIAVIISSAAFALYHNGVFVDGGLNWSLFMTFFVAGAYFGVLYLWRGFGIAVGVHAFYDVVVLVLLQGQTSG